MDPQYVPCTLWLRRNPSAILSVTEPLNRDLDYHEAVNECRRMERMGFAAYVTVNTTGNTVYRNKHARELLTREEN